MPANLTPDFLAAQERFREAETTEDKLAALHEMYATIPKHKGTEKMRADIRRRISKLHDKEKQARKVKGRDEFHVIKQGAGQMVLLGPPNSGKSALMDRLTSAAPDVAEYAFTTRRPLPGMMEYEDIAIQLVDTPAISRDYLERGVISIARTADAIGVVVDLSEDSLLDQFEDIREELGNSRTMLLGARSPQDDISAAVLTLDTMIIANKSDLDGAADNLEVLREFYGGEFDIHVVSVETGEGLEELRHAIFDLLGIIRVYTKIPGKPPDRDKPFTLKKGSTLTDFAAIVHKDFVDSMRFARAWGEDVLDGAQIGRDHELQDGYVIELHTR